METPKENLTPILHQQSEGVYWLPVTLVKNFFITLGKIMSEITERITALEVRIQRIEQIEDRLVKMEQRQAVWSGGLMLLQVVVPLAVAYFLKH